MVDFVDNGSMGFRYFIFELGDGFIRDSTDDKILGFEEICNRLNEQQTTITALKEENDILKQKLRKNYIANKQYEEMKRLQKENEQLLQIKEILQQEIKDTQAILEMLTEKLKGWNDE